MGVITNRIVTTANTLPTTTPAPVVKPQGIETLPAPVLDIVTAYACNDTVRLFTHTTKEALEPLTQLSRLSAIMEKTIQNFAFPETHASVRRIQLAQKDETSASANDFIKLPEVDISTSPFWQLATKHFPNITTVQLSEKMLYDEEGERLGRALAQFPRLNSAEIVDYFGWYRLDGLAQMPALRQVKLEASRFGTRCESGQTIPRMLRANPHLESLHMTGFHLRRLQDGMAQQMQKIREITLSLGAFQESFEQIRQLPNLEKIHLWDITPTLRRLHLHEDDPDFNAADFTELKNLKKLAEITLAIRDPKCRLDLNKFADLLPPQAKLSVSEWASTYPHDVASVAKHLGDVHTLRFSHLDTNSQVAHVACLKSFQKLRDLEIHTLNTPSQEPAFSPARFSYVKFYRTHLPQCDVWVGIPQLPGYVTACFDSVDPKCKKTGIALYNLKDFEISTMLPTVMNALAATAMKTIAAIGSSIISQCKRKA